MAFILKFGILAFVAFQAINFNGVHTCNHRLIEPENDATLCVCSEKLGCDNLDHLNHIPKVKGQVTSFVTNRAGARLTAREFHFAPAAPKPDKLPHLEVNLNRAVKHQKIIGFGGAFTDSTGINIAKLVKPLQERLIRDYFAVDGLEYRMSRVPIAGCDFSVRAYSYDDHPDGETLNHFALQEEDLKYKIPLMQLAQKVSTHHLKFFGSPWSAPAWMKTNNHLNKGGFLKGEPGGKYYKLFAEYTRKFVQEYSKHNLTMWAVTPENEPQFGNAPNFKYESMGVNRTQERDYIKMDLGPELEKSGFGQVKILAIDDSIDRDFVDYATTVLSDKDAAKYIAGVGYHWYGNQNHYDRITSVAKLFPDKFLLNTEACEFIGPHVPFGRWSSFNHYAGDILTVLNRDVSGWIEWNLALSTTGGPSWVNTHLNSPIIVNETSQEYYKQPIFYVMGHFSKFLLPDSVRIDSQIVHDQKGVQLTTVVRPDNSTVVSVLNENGFAVELHLHDPERGYLNAMITPFSLDTLVWY